MTGDVFGWFTVSRTSTTTCDYSAWGNAARTAATNAGVDLSSYQSVMYYWPQQTACSWAGLGQLPGSTIWPLQKMSVPVLFGSSWWPASRPAAESQTS